MSVWYPVFCKPRGEMIAERNLGNQSYEVYLPRLSIRRRGAGGWVDRIEPLFPRYLFVRPRDRGQSLAPVRSTLGVSDFVRVGAQPAVISESVITRLREHEDPNAGVHLYPDALQPGRRVKFVDGPFKGLEGVLDMDLGKHRVMVLLDLLGKTNRLQIERDWLVVLT
jgi:transcriptional antiterminator RfaH